MNSKLIDHAINMRDRSHSPCNECDVDGLLSGNEFAKKWGEFYEKS